ncbi:site-2 protease family protein [Rhodohalobacter sp. SW132]|uniref:site-2 protease family protein n=1 Tax=Rhodohalobacter sp. SW132 TaxID=2293433 RepID=UPI000E276D18|nr:site-2 protease family protein [Rhodohalobacter sp. SW132]REL38924.1 site-2 protease family protein [Rhodohalobacter sp. SW132]
MPYPHSNIPETETEPIPKQEESINSPGTGEIIKHSALFIITFACVTFFGIFWVGQGENAESYLDMWPEGALFAALLLGFLATHEFGHYFAAVYHKVRVSLPYFIPLPLGIGTMGAVIKIKEQIHSTKKLFDVGISGPIAGFIASLLILLYGFITLPDPSFIENFSGHEEITQHVEQTGAFPDEPPAPPEGAGVIILGDTILYSFLASFFDDVPPMYEMYHYPFLFAGWLGLFFTALNLMPIGQLDGGHILYSLLGYKKHQNVARWCFGGITLLAGIEAIPFLYLQFSEWIPGFEISSTVIWALVLFFLLRKGFHGAYEWIAPVWTLSLIGSVGYLYFLGDGLDQAGSLIWVFWSFFLVYFVKIEHPPVIYEQRLSPNRRLLGWISMIVFILCISPSPISVIS